MEVCEAVRKVVESMKSHQRYQETADEKFGRNISDAVFNDLEQRCDNADELTVAQIYESIGELN